MLSIMEIMDNIINNSIVYYINLDERTDRNEHILTELLQLFPKEIIHRYSAIKHQNGAIGCSQSHINVLFQFIKSNKDYCFIFEDDFQFLFPITNIQNIIINALSNDFNLLLMSYNGLGIVINYEQIKNNIAYSIKNARTTAGYIVHRQYAKILLNNYLSGLQQLIETEDKTKYAIDMYWNILQNTENKFYAIMPCIGTQLAGYSSIELKDSDYVQCNTCIILTDFDINNNKSPFFCLKYNYIDEKIIKNIKYKYPKIKYLLRITEDFFNKLNWKIIYDIYKNIIYTNMKKNYNNPYFKLSVNNNTFYIDECKSLHYDTTFIMILN
jgi:GR25 family glycosyltransferase involved in LPS biosynthesis